MALNLATTFPIFAPPLDPDPNPRPSTEIQFSRPNTANGYTPENSTPNANQTSHSAGNPYKKPPKPTVDRKSHPALRFSNIPKQNLRPVTKTPENVKISEDGLSYVIEGAPFEFKYSYTETPKAKPLKMREPAFVPFGPATMPRPWTGRPPLPPSKKKKKEFDSFVLPPPHKKGVKPVQSPGPYLPGTSPRYVKSREEILGEPLTQEEIHELVKNSMKSSRQLNMGRDGFTHNMLDNIHALWKRRRVCKIKCKGVCTVDMDSVCQQLEEKTGGKIIHRRGGVLYLFRGRNYNYKTHPRFPLMLWKPVPPVYPRLIQRIPEGLTLEEATELRQKGKTLTPICKLGKNGVYFNLVNNVKEAFEECELVRINCQGLNKSDYHKIGAKLRDLVPCTLLSFNNEHILVWRGRNWKSTLPDLRDDSMVTDKTDMDNEHHKTLPLEALDGSAPCLQNNVAENVSSLSQDTNIQNNLAEHVSNLSLDTSISSGSDNVTVDKVEMPRLIKNSKQSMSVIADASLTKAYEAETTDVPSDSYGEPESCRSTSPSLTMSHYDSRVSDSHGTADIMDSKSLSDGLSASVSGSGTMLGSSDSSIYGIVDPHTDELLDDDSGAANVSLPSWSAPPCMKEISLLLEQAVEEGSAFVLDKDSLDADNIYQTTVSFTKSAPPGPVFRKHRKVAVKKGDKQEDSALETRETTIVSAKGKREKRSRSLRKENFDERFLNVVPQGTLGVDELAKLLT